MVTTLKGLKKGGEIQRTRRRKSQGQELHWVVDVGIWQLLRFL